MKLMKIKLPKTVQHYKESSEKIKGILAKEDYERNKK
jgi:hypothetical protein